MKFAIIIPSGAADEPLAELGDITPLAAAKLPALHELAACGRLGTARTVPEGVPPSSEVVLPAVLGYDPLVFPLPRGPIEAFARGIRLGRRDAALRLNFVTVEDERLRDLAAGYIETREAAALLEALRSALPDQRLELHAGRSFRHLLVWREAGPLTRLETTPPHAVLDGPVRRGLPRGRESRPLVEFIRRASEILAAHDINAVRRDMGELPANAVWLWGQGPLPPVPSFESRFGLRGAAVAGTDLMRGLARLLRWEVRDVPTATGLLATDLAGKGRAAVTALDDADLVCVHIEALDEASHLGSGAEKVRVLEQIDQHIVAPLVERLRREAAWRMLVMPDHTSSTRRRTHSPAPTLFVLAGSGIESSRGERFDEASAVEGEMHPQRASDLMEYFVRR